MSRFVRQSKVRHVYGECAKPENQYTNIRLSTATGDHNYIKANSKYFAIPISAGNGSLFIGKWDNPGRIDPQPPCLDLHKGAVLDFDFNPMHDNLIASGGDDCTIKLWGIPDGGLKSSGSEPLVDIHQFQRKVSVVRFHPTAEHVLAAGSADTTVKIFDMNEGEARASFAPTDALVQDLDWNRDGSILATSSKDKKLRLCDPRTSEVVNSVEAHEGSKTSKLVWLGEDSGHLCTVGFTRQSKRQFKIWDPKKLDTPICTTDIDQAAGVLMPFFDPDTNMLIFAGKGDNSIRYYEMVPEAPWQFLINKYQGQPVKGMAVLPKRAVDVTRCEVLKLAVLTTNAVQPVSFICPRKSDLFQDDLYPDCYAGKPACTAGEFFDGKTVKAPKMSLDPSKRKANEGGSAKAESSFAPVETKASLKKQVADQDKYIEKLIQHIKSNNLKVPEP